MKDTLILAAKIVAFWLAMTMLVTFSIPPLSYVYQVWEGYWK